MQTPLGVGEVPAAAPRPATRTQVLSSNDDVGGKLRSVNASMAA